jgi:hypothetical protein
MLLAAVIVTAWIDDASDSGEWWGFEIEQLVALWLAGFAAGCIVHRWRAVLLALLPVFVAIPFGYPDMCASGFYLGCDRLVYDMAALAVICAGFIATGVAIVRYSRDPGSLPLRWMSTPAKLFAFVAGVGLVLLVAATLDELFSLAIWNGDYWPAWGEGLDGSYASGARATYGDFAAQVGLLTGLAGVIALSLVADARRQSE